MYGAVVWTARRLSRSASTPHPFALAWLTACFYGAGTAVWALADRHALVFSGIYAWPLR